MTRYVIIAEVIVSWQTVVSGLITWLTRRKFSTVGF